MRSPNDPTTLASQASRRSRLFRVAAVPDAFDPTAQFADRNSGKKHGLA